MKNWPKVKTGKYVTFGYLPEDFYIISSPRKKNSTNVKIQFDFDFIDDENEQMKVVKQFLKFYQRSWTVNKLQTEVKYIVHSHKKNLSCAKYTSRQYYFRKKWVSNDTWKCWDSELSYENCLAANSRSTARNSRTPTTDSIRRLLRNKTSLALSCVINYAACSMPRHRAGQQYPNSWRHRQWTLLVCRWSCQQFTGVE